MEENSENEDQELLEVGLYTITLTDNNNQQYIKHNYLVANIDSTSFLNPIDTLTASIDTCSNLVWEQAEIDNFVVLDNEVIVTWKSSFFAYDSIEFTTFHAVTYSLENNTSGFYVYKLSVLCEGNNIEYSYEDIIYMDFDIMTGLKSKELFEGKIYPNPTEGIVNIDAEDVFEIVLTDITGRVIFNINQTNTDGKSQIDLSNQNSGIYLLHLKTKEGQQVVKLIKE